MAVSNGQVLTMLDSTTGKTVYQLDGIGEAFCFSSDGKWMAASEGDEKIRIREAHNGRELLAIPWAGGRLCFSPDGRRIAGCCAGIVKIWDTVAGAELLTLKAIQGGDIRFLAGGRRLLLEDNVGKYIIWDTETVSAPD
jgi:WD40 repeat protein